MWIGVEAGSPTKAKVARCYHQQKAREEHGPGRRRSGPHFRMKDVCMLRTLPSFRVGSRFGSGALSMQSASIGTDQPSFEQIELGPAKHLSLHELEAGDLPLDLAVRPRLG
jgi:hypothetical protein